jgi:hypothetical protein
MMSQSDLLMTVAFVISVTTASSLGPCGVLVERQGGPLRSWTGTLAGTVIRRLTYYHSRFHLQLP